MANVIKIWLNTPEPPSRCDRCPLIGLIPVEKRCKGHRKKYCCLGVSPHKPLTTKGVSVDVEEKREKTGHIVHRPCEDRWESWYNSNQNHTVNINRHSYDLCRRPYEQMMEPEFDFG